MTLDLSIWPVAHPHPTEPWTVTNRTGEWAVFDPERDSVQRVDPMVDPKLPAIAHVGCPDALVAYRIGRRAVFQTSAGFVKVVRPRRLDSLIAKHRVAARSGVWVPSICAAESSGLVLLGAMRGTSLHHVLLRERAHLPLIEAIGAELGRFHARAERTELSDRSRPDPSRFITAAGRVWPECVGALQREAAGLPDIGDAPEVAIHGDLHDKNVFVGSEGVGLIDLDGLRCGHAEEDVANLAVHLELRALQAGLETQVGVQRRAALRRGYESQRHLDLATYDAYARHTWFRLACLYLFRARSQHLVPALLRRARHRQQHGDLCPTELAVTDQ